MVPDTSTLTRRRLLGGVAGLAAGSTVAIGATRPTLLPDIVTDLATKWYPTPPEMNTLWQPPVTKSHAAAAVDRLETTVSKGRRHWQRLETDEDFLGAGGWLDNARQAFRNGHYDEALFDAMYGMQFAGESLGIARARLGEADLRALATRGSELLTRMRRVASGLDPYPVSDPGRDLAWYYAIERQLLFGRRHADWGGRARDGVDDADAPNTSADDPRRIGTITASVRQADLYARNAEQYRDHHAALLEESNADYADHLRRVVDRFAAEVDSFPTHSAVRSTYIEDDEPYGPYEFAHSRLARWCFDHDFRFGWDDSDGLTVHRAVELSRGVAQRRAHAVATDRLVVDETDEGFDSGHTLAAKRRARATYRSVVGANPPPVLTRQVRRAVEDLQVANVGFGGSYQRPLWRERLKAYLYALVGRAKLEQYPSVYDVLVNATESR